MGVSSIGSPVLWIGFLLFIGLMLFIDLGIFNRRAHEISVREASLFTLLWIVLSLLFNLGIWHWFGTEKALQFLTGYLVEKALSVDNIFVFLVLFRYFSVPRSYQHRVLFFGVLGALIMRGVFIIAGAALISKFHIMTYLLGALLVFTGIKLFKESEISVEPERNLVLRLFRKVVPATSTYRTTHFVVHEGGRYLATPLLAVLVAVETTDVAFAIDSIPAIFAISTDAFIVFTSNIFAILGLRALYFLLAGVMEELRYLRFGLALVLSFVGIKMIAADWYDLPISWSLTIIALLLGCSVLASLLPLKQEGHEKSGDN